MKRFRLINIVLLLLIALVVWRTISVWRRGVPQVQARMDAPGRAPGDSLPGPGRKPALPQMVAVIAEKDLFDASRKAPEVAQPAPERTPTPPPTLKLSGVLVVGGEREAVLTDMAQGNRQIRMREGEDISGYKVSKITADEISLVSGSGEEVTLSLQIDKTKGPHKGFGPGGKPVAHPPPAQARPQQAQAAPANAPQQPAPMPPAQMYPGAFGPPGIGGTQPPPAMANDAKRRMESARERLKRLRAESAGK
jgi:type II secretory pathway component PulC